MAWRAERRCPDCGTIIPAGWACCWPCQQERDYAAELLQHVAVAIAPAPHPTNLRAIGAPAQLLCTAVSALGRGRREGPQHGPRALVHPWLRAADAAGGVDRVPVRSPLRTLAALMRARWVKACGKLPTCRLRATSYSSAYKPTSLRSASSRSNSFRASSSRPLAASASTSQNEQARNWASLPDRPSSMVPVKRSSVGGSRPTSPTISAPASRALEP